MINADQVIPCPVCKTRIPFDTKELLMGIQFVCPTCSAAIGLSKESKEIVEDTMSKLSDLKGKMAKSKKQ